MASTENDTEPVRKKKKTAKSIPTYSSSYTNESQITSLVTNQSLVVTGLADGGIKFWKQNKDSKNGKDNKGNKENAISLKCIKKFMAHSGHSISQLLLNRDGSKLVTVAKDDNHIKIFDLTTLDMMQAIKLPFVPNTVTSHCNSWFTIDGVDTILIGDQDTNNVFWIVSEEVQEKTLVAKKSPHKRPIRSIVYSYKYECFISCDEKGLVEYWHPKSLQLPLGLEFKIKSQTDLFKLIKTKTISNNILISQNSEYFIVQSDNTIHRFCFKTGKIVQIIQEEHILSTYLNGNSIFYSTKEEILAYDFLQQQEIANYGTNDKVKYNFVALASETQTTPISSEMITSKNSLVNSKLNKQQLLVATTANKLMVFDSEDKSHGNTGKTKQPKVTLHTTFGDIKIELFDKLAPKTAENFITLCKRKYYNNVIFHRVIKSFMIQTGDPKGDGTGGESCWRGHFPDEFNNQLNHKQPFMVSMANAGPNTNGSQFFITTDEASFLDNKHTVFGKVISGIDTVKQIEGAETDENDKPIEQIAIISTTLEI